MVFMSYYKGLGLTAPVPFENEKKFLAAIVKAGHNQIDAGLRSGESLINIKATIISQLETLKGDIESIVKREGLKFGQLTCQTGLVRRALEQRGSKMKSLEAITMWFMNIASLLELKYIENDDLNGWLLTSINADGINFYT